MMRGAGHNEISICFVQDEGDVSGLGEFCELVQELWGVYSTSLQTLSANTNYWAHNTYWVVWADENYRFGFICQKRFAVLDLWLKTSGSKCDQGDGFNS